MQEQLSGMLDTASSLAAESGLKILGAIVVLFIGRMIARWLKRMSRKAMTKANVDETLIPFLSGLVYAMMMVAVVLMAVSTAGVNTTSFIAIFGAAGLAVALAFQGTFSNFASGVMLLIFRPISVGHYVEIGGTAGTVKAIDIFTTVMDTPDNVRIIVPNTAIFGQTIKNYSANPTRRIDLVMGVGYSDDLGKAMEVMQRVIKADERVLEEPAPLVAVAELADSSVNFVVRPWCRAEDYWALRFDLTKAFKESIDEAGLNIPFPQRDVHIHNVA